MGESLPRVSHVAHPQTRFRWRNRSGDWILVEEMKTRHLFFTVKMIWNHTVPEDWKIRPFIRYRFGTVYTSHFMKLAVKHMLAELCLRDDIAPEWADQLNFMVGKWMEDKLNEP